MTRADDPPSKDLSEPVAALLEAFHARTPIRTGSLVVTIFGDAVVPRGGVLSLASLLRITRVFRIGDGPVRTALSRLVGDGWFARSKAGRNAFYRLAASGRQAFVDASDRIYRSSDRPWHGRFDAVLLDGEDREEFRAAWATAGYGQLSNDLMIAPARSEIVRAAVSETLHLDLIAPDAATARRLARRGWPLGEMARRYEGFIDLYHPIAAWLRHAPAMTGIEALLVRLSLIHDFRRIVLADPRLPAALLPEDWPGARARRLCTEIYRAVVAGAEQWLDLTAENEAGGLPPPDATFGARFTP